MGATAGQAADATRQTPCRGQRISRFRHFRTLKNTHSQINQANRIFFIINFHHRPTDGCNADVETEDVIQWIGFKSSHLFLRNFINNNSNISEKSINMQMK